MRIGELAGRTGFSVRNIRFYEQQGLLPAPQRTEGGYRVYDQDAVTRLRFVRAYWPRCTRTWQPTPGHEPARSIRLTLHPTAGFTVRERYRARR